MGSDFLLSSKSTGNSFAKRKINKVSSKEYMARLEITNYEQ